jgi:hypothetical protein
MAPSVEVNVPVTVRSYIFVSLMLLGGVRLEDDAEKATTCACGSGIKKATITVYIKQ